MGEQWLMVTSLHFCTFCLATDYPGSPRAVWRSSWWEGREKKEREKKICWECMQADSDWTSYGRKYLGFVTRGRADGTALKQHNRTEEKPVCSLSVRDRYHEALFEEKYWASVEMYELSWFLFLFFCENPWRRIYRSTIVISPHHHTRTIPQ